MNLETSKKKTLFKNLNYNLGTLYELMSIKIYFNAD